MVMVKISELEGVALDYAMAVMEALPIRHDPMAFGNTANGGYWIWPDASEKGMRHMQIGPNPNPSNRDMTYSPHTDWSQLGPLILKYPIVLGNHESESGDGKFWGRAHCFDPATNMETKLGVMVAACRAMLASKFGVNFSVPESLLRARPQASF